MSGAVQFNSIRLVSFSSRVRAPFHPPFHFHPTPRYFTFFFFVVLVSLVGCSTGAGHAAPPLPRQGVHRRRRGSEGKAPGALAILSSHNFLPPPPPASFLLEPGGGGREGGARACACAYVCVWCPRFFVKGIVFSRVAFSSRVPSRYTTHTPIRLENQGPNVWVFSVNNTETNVLCLTIFRTEWCVAGVRRRLYDRL